MELISNAAKLQRPMARTNPVWPGCVTARLYHRNQRSATIRLLAGFVFSPQTKVTARITKAHAHGTSVRFPLQMRCSVVLQYWQTQAMAKSDFLDDVHIRILRVTEDLRTIQRELNCAAMEAPGDPELMEALSQLPEMDALQVLKSALDQMRHFLWFYMQVMTNESDSGEKLRQSLRQRSSEDAGSGPSVLEKFRYANTAMLRYLSDGKNRKPN
jgi:hypothetical protein